MVALILAFFGLVAVAIAIAYLAINYGEKVDIGKQIDEIEERVRRLEQE